MPFYEARSEPQQLNNLDLKPVQDDPTLLETFGAAFRTENMVGSYLSAKGVANPAEEEEGFNPIDYVKDDSRFAPYADQFAGISNSRAADALKTQILRQQGDRRTLDAAGIMGTAASIGAGFFDVPTLLPLGGIVAGGVGAAQMAGRLALASGIDAAVSEVGLQATQATRTPQETALNIGGSVVLGGALGGLIGRYMTPSESSVLSRKIESQEQEFEQFDRSVFGPSSAGAAARDRGPLVLKDENIISKLPVISRQDPLIRLQLSELNSGRETVRGLAETPLEYAENAAGVATERGGAVETRIKMWNAPLAEGLQQMDTLFARYYQGAPEPTGWQRRLSPTLSEFDRLRGKTGKLTYKEFKEEVGRAAYSGDTHQIPEVAQAAKVYREMDEAMKKAAIEAGLFPEDIKVAGDVSHRFRMYNRQAIISRRDEFRSILRDYFIDRQRSAAFRAEENDIARRVIDTDKARDRFNQSFSKLEELEGRLNDRLQGRQERTGRLNELRSTRLDTMRERAPKGVVEALRGADETASMVEAVRDNRKAARSASAKKPFAERFPVLATIRQKGGVRIGTQLDQELRAMGVTPKTNPGLFRKDGGIGDVDNIVASEDDFFSSLADDGNGYVDRRAVLDAIRSELSGNPIRTAEQLAEADALENLDRAASEWLERVGLPDNASVKDVREYIGRVMGAEKDLDAFDAKISKLEAELEEFDTATDALRNERNISDAEAKVIASDLEELEASIDAVSEIANASPRVSLIVDAAKTRRDLFKAKLRQRSLTNRVEAIERARAAGTATDEMLAEAGARQIDLDRLNTRISSLQEKADKLDKMTPSRTDMEKTQDFADMSPAEVDSLVDETINTVLGHSEGRMPYDIVAGPRGALKDRVLKIETSKIHDFVQNDIEEVMRAQFRTMSADVELQKKFGSVDLKDQIAKINDEADARIGNAKDAAERKRIEAQRVADVRDVEAIRDRLRGTYALPANPDGLVLRAGRIARNINYLRLLGGMTISAVPDMAKVVFTHGLTSTFRDGFLPMVKNFQAVKMAGREVKMAGTALDMVLDSRVMALGDITDDFGRHSKFERGLQSLSTRFGVVSLMAPWNASLKQFAGLVTMTNMLRSSQRVALGKGSASDIRKLAAAGIDEDLASRIARQFSEHGDEQDGVFLAKAADWSDIGAQEAFRAAVVRDVDRIIVTPGQDKPLWMSTELGKTVGQFKSFGTASIQKTLLAGMQQRDAATLNGTMLMLGLGAFTYAMKQMNAEQPLSDNPAVWAVEALDRSGITGWLMDGNNIAEKFTRGRVGFSALTGEQVSRYGSRNVIGSFLGPTPEAIADIFQISGSVFAGDTARADLRRARQLIPGQNLFYLRQLFNQAEQSTGDALNLPEKRKQ